MTVRPAHLNAYEFVVVSVLRAHQLRAGSVPRLPGEHNATTMAQMEVAGGCVARSNANGPAGPRQCGWQR
jgi:DNA-directed RNA polymerase subunit K/omega